MDCTNTSQTHEKHKKKHQLHESCLECGLSQALAASIHTASCQRRLGQLLASVLHTKSPADLLLTCITYDTDIFFFLHHTCRSSFWYFFNVFVLEITPHNHFPLISSVISGIIFIYYIISTNDTEHILHLFQE